MKIFIKIQLTALFILVAFSSSVCSQVSGEEWLRIDVKPVIDIIALKDQVELASNTSANESTVASESIIPVDQISIEASPVDINTNLEAPQLSSNDLIEVFAENLLENEESDVEDQREVESQQVNPGFTYLLDELSDKDRIKTYPNPATDLLNVELGRNSVYELNLYNLVGSLEFSIILSDQRSTSIDLSNLPEGIYLLQIAEGLEVSTHKIKVAR